MNEVDALLELLDRWRHFPSYQLERRADIFFALYLPGIVEHATGVAVDSRVIPEFLIKREDNKKSKKVDYFLLSRDRSRAFLVELKTEMRSRRATQDAYLRLAQERGLNVLLSHLPEMATASDQKRKYVHLFVALEELGLVRLPQDLRDYAAPTVRRGITKRLEAVETVPTNASIEVIYLQPREAGTNVVISFKTVADYLRTLDEPLARTLAGYVERWVEPAGLGQ